MAENTTPDQSAAGVEPTPAVSVVGRVRAVLRRWPRAVRSALSSRAARRAGVAAAVVAVSLAGVVIGVLLGARATSDVGPFRAEMSIIPAVHGDTEIGIPPLGSLHLDSHDAPLKLKVQLGSLDQARTEALFGDPGGITRASETVVEDVTAGVMRLGLRTIGVAVLSALVLAALVFRDFRRVAWAGSLALAVTGGSLGLAVATLRPDSIEEPRYEGLLVNAPSVVGDARRIADNYGRYAEQLQALVGNVSRIYSTVSTLPVYEPAENTTRVLHVSDLHLSPTAWSVVQTVVEQFEIDVVIDSGDITDWGSEPEASYVASIGLLQRPYVYIRGNHDSRLTAEAVARQPNAVVLDNETTTVSGLTIAGIGDPRFTPDKDTSPAEEPAAGLGGVLEENGRQLAETVLNSDRPVDIAVVHDPAAAGPLSGACPLVLAGHTHEREVRMLEAVPGGMPTRLMVEGSTGGAGLRGLEGEQPEPLAMSVLYFDEERVLKAHDDIRVGGTGQAEVTLERKVIDDSVPEEAPPATPAPSGPGPAGPDATEPDATGPDANGPDDAPASPGE